jgi:hypothetical protein
MTLGLGRLGLDCVPIVCQSGTNAEAAPMKRLLRRFLDLLPWTILATVLYYGMRAYMFLPHLEYSLNALTLMG